MRIKNLTIVALTVMALVSATGAFATITCGAANDLGGGNVDMMVTTDNGPWGGVAADTAVGGAVISLGDCVVGGGDCTFSVQGIPGGATPQSGGVAFLDGDGAPITICTITDADGLPVELVEFSVE